MCVSLKPPDKETHGQSEEQQTPSPNAPSLPRSLRAKPAIWGLVVKNVVQEVSGLVFESLVIESPGKRDNVVEPIRCRLM